MGAGKPRRDVWVTPGHSFLLNGVLIQSEKLINGATVVQQPRDAFEIWHLELESHDVVLAEGVPAETYLDVGNRRTFANGDAFLQQFAEFEAKRSNDTCVPLVLNGANVVQAKADLLARAVELGHRVVDDDDLHVVADGKRVEPVRVSKTRRFFVVPEASADVVLHSNQCVPARVRPDSDDRRVLGVCVGRLQIDGEDRVLDHDSLFSSPGWHPFESRRYGGVQRWTSGAARMPAGCRLIVLDTTEEGLYWSLEQPLGGGTGLN